MDFIYNLEFTENEKKDIQLCLNCPYPECTNCLDRDHKPGERPERGVYSKYEELREKIRDLMLNTNLSNRKIASYLGCSMYHVNVVSRELRGEGAA